MNHVRFLDGGLEASDLQYFAVALVTRLPGCHVDAGSDQDDADDDACLHECLPCFGDEWRMDSTERMVSSTFTGAEAPPQQAGGGTRRRRSMRTRAIVRMVMRTVSALSLIHISEPTRLG